ncbi:malto-oligosyltrehalose trehalohydrolase [Streptantibioticus silvisoli]|uniref:Malto-oligosyltrehalose trehalohydrolase n=1 Tax=Streptantibioticus silvisoli TaxID=2705255 RepID=A0ABT6W0J7_9ACTN|nr:malto-oligosyltrehalose trehalohydrolase [Streptantibioticus silvisoli]MDI5964194.1 malto-oligosyltrehalose trehalohydrolase [Streptantibioticus silvisoli]
MRYEVWAPLAGRVEVVVDGADHPMRRDPVREGWWTADAGPDGGDGQRYAFRLDGGEPLPDPRSRRQPQGPDGPSAVVAPPTWAGTQPWHGRPLAGAVLYELHVGTFTREGTFDAAAARLGHLAALGVTHVELLPVCPFPGTHGWGYDGVSLWAVHEPYGGPAGLRRFVAAAHRHGLGVVLDVVHNHLGPSGNHLSRFGPYFTDTHTTPWGAAVNLDAPGSDEVRAYLVGSALAWIRDFRLDGLRLDAVHALVDTRAVHFLEELSRAVDALAHEVGRPLFLIAESDLNDPRTTADREAGGLGLHAQWSDDFHHALHTALTGESGGYYADFARAPLAALARTLSGGFFHDGSHSSFRGRGHGRPWPAGASGHRLLGYAQTHDQIGNRALGDRLTARQLTLAAALVLTSPFTPMLFMGEEWGAATAWQYFTDHPDPALAEAVRTGRRREFAAHGWDAAEIPDPQDPATRLRSCLDWEEPERAPHDRLLAWYRTLIALRRAEPDLGSPDLAATAVTYDEADGWLLVRRGSLHVAVNFADVPRTLPLHGGEVLASSAELPHGEAALTLPGWTAAVLRGGQALRGGAVRG